MANRRNARAPRTYDEAELAVLSPSEQREHTLNLQAYVATTVQKDAKVKAAALLRPIIKRCFREVKYPKERDFEGPLHKNKYALRILKRAKITGDPARFYGLWKGLMQTLHRTVRNSFLADIKSRVKRMLQDDVIDATMREQVAAATKDEITAMLGRQGPLWWVVTVKLARTAKDGPQLPKSSYLTECVLPNDEAFLRSGIGAVLLRFAWSSNSGSNSKPTPEFLAYFKAVFDVVKAERAAEVLTPEDDDGTDCEIDDFIEEEVVLEEFDGDDDVVPSRPRASMQSGGNGPPARVSAQGGSQPPATLNHEQRANGGETAGPAGPVGPATAHDRESPRAASRSPSTPPVGSAAQRGAEAGRRRSSEPGQSDDDDDDAPRAVKRKSQPYSNKDSRTGKEAKKKKKKKKKQAHHVDSDSDSEGS